MIISVFTTSLSTLNTLILIYYCYFNSNCSSLYLIPAEIGHFWNVGHLCFFSLNYLLVPVPHLTCLTLCLFLSFPCSALFNRALIPIGCIFQAPLFPEFCLGSAMGDAGRRLERWRKGEIVVFLLLFYIRVFMQQGLFPILVSSLHPGYLRS